MAYSVEQAHAVQFLLREDSLEMADNLVFVRPVVDGVLEIVQHLGDLEVGATMLRALEGTDSGGNR